VRELIQSEITRFNSSLASFETIKKFVILFTDFTIENGLLTPTFKVKRGLVTTRFKDEIDQLYNE
jgi:long-chain acyl-CoA synthetase